MEGLVATRLVPASNERLRAMVQCALNLAAQSALT
jgi:hypothetical protein